MKINPVDNMTRSVNSISREMNWGIVFTEHGSSHLNESPILAFQNPILLWHICYRELMGDTKLIKKFLPVEILEFYAIVTPHVLDDDTIVILSSTCNFFEVILGFTFIHKKIYPAESRKIINENETVVVTTQPFIVLWSE